MQAGRVVGYYAVTHCPGFWCGLFGAGGCWLEGLGGFGGEVVLSGLDGECRVSVHCGWGGIDWSLEICSIPATADRCNVP